MKSMVNKKSQGMPINTVIIAAIALAVLVVLIVIFTGGIGKTSQNLGSCVTKGGVCANTNGLNNQCGGPYPIPLIVSGDCQNTQPVNLCCIKSGQ
ncbi:MAG: DUF948 domain-containing protein [Nanoarchaeota archaeon]